MADAQVNSDNAKDVLEIISNSSLIDFLKLEEENLDENELFSEINRLASLNCSKFVDDKDDRSIEKLLKEAETLINQPIGAVQPTCASLCEIQPLEERNYSLNDEYDYSTTKVLSLSDDLSDRTLLNDQLDSCFDSCSSSSESVSSMKPKRTKSKKKKQKEDLEYVPEQSREDIAGTSVSPENIQTDYNFYEEKVLCDKSTAPSPTHSMVSSSSFSWARERELENTNDSLHEKLKDTVERYNSLRIQHESLSQIHRVLRENHVQLQEEIEKIKIDFQILNECTNVLRVELQTAKQDRDAASEIAINLQRELDENRTDRKKFQIIADRDSKTIQDLQRQCREMERILMRKHPDSVSALIVASKNSNFSSPDTSASTRKILEERIAQLEADVRGQDNKAQGILSNVQARFKTVQSKYENHIQDLETQVLSLQQINMEQSKELFSKSSLEVFTSATQTLDIPEKESPKTRSTGVQTSSTSNPPSRSGSAQSISGTKKSTKVPSAQSDSAVQQKEDSHLLATIRGMRIELAIKEKAVQRLNRELEECKKTVRKLQKERDTYLAKDKLTTTSTPKKVYNPANYQENSDSQSLKEAFDKIKLLETDYKSLYEKRVKDLKILQNAHERDLSASHETIRILQNRLEEQLSTIGSARDKRRGPVDYYALKAKVTSLEIRHSKREKSLHLLIDALSKGKISGLSPEDSSSPQSCSSPVNKNL